jgi:hypothetical protein
VKLGGSWNQTQTLGVEVGNAAAVLQNDVQPALRETQILRVDFEMRQVGLAVEATASLGDEGVLAKVLRGDDLHGKRLKLVSLVRVPATENLKNGEIAFSVASLTR